jgi:hypothetical protein
MRNTHWLLIWVDPEMRKPNVVVVSRGLSLTWEGARLGFLV